MPSHKPVDPMELRAEVVLTDCRRTIENLEAERSPELFRIWLVAAFALVRAVGHVLHKIDGEGSEEIRLAVKKFWDEWKKGEGEHRIFKDFIEHERNAILKTYEFNFDPDPRPIPFTDGKEVFQLENEDLFYVPADWGPYAGEDVRELLGQACDWWSRQLARVKDEASR